MAEQLPEIFHDLISNAIDEAGVYPHQAIAKRADGKLEMMALDGALLGVLVAKANEPQIVELIYGFDRMTRPGQGTEFADCLAGAYYQQGAGWRPLVIDYQHEPRIVRPINWANGFWAQAIRRELDSAGVTDVLDVVA